VSEFGSVDSQEGLRLSFASPSTDLSREFWGNLLRPLALPFLGLNSRARQTGRPEVPAVSHSSENLHDGNVKSFVEPCAQGLKCLIGINIHIKQKSKIIESI
jgi:hypothetical protein